MNDYQRLIAVSRYARWLPELGRRETWEETVRRYVDYWAEYLSPREEKKIYEAISELEVVPSMRALMTAGEALTRDHVAGYNCAYLPINSPRAFDECMYILMCGTGLGFSCEQDEVAQLPEVPDTLEPCDTVIKVGDSKIGWASSLKKLIALLYAGDIPKWDISAVRPAGSRLQVFGGRASGPAPLVELFEFVVHTFKGATGRKLNDLECHDIMCKIGEIVIVGGVRRSALISLSSPESDRMRHAKSGNWWETAPHRALANNSACYTEDPDFGFFMREMTALYESMSGERGIFSRKAAKNIAGRNGRRNTQGVKFGCNPCSEILLQPNQFCNLSEVIVRPKDTLEELQSKVELCTILGTLQATLTNFRYLRPVWKRHAEDEALLGVSFTGLMDHPVMNGSKGTEKLAEWLENLRNVSINTNKKWAKRLGIAQAAAITCVKPSGTVSQLALCASGCHPNFAPEYIRTIRQDNKDPVTDLLKAEGVYWEPCVMKPDNTAVFSFPITAPKTSVFQDDVGAIGQLEIWKVYQNHWCEHKPSITVYYTDDEYFEVCQWVWKNMDIMSGISLLPKSDHTYKQAPYTAADDKVVPEYDEFGDPVYTLTNKEKFDLLVKEQKPINWDRLAEFELEDTTTGSQELACTGGACEIVGSGL